MQQKTSVQYVRFYTDGSAARKVAVAAPFQTAKLPRAKKKKHIVLCIDPVAMAAILMAVVMTVLLATGVAELCRAKAQVEVMTHQVELLKVKNEQLQTDYARGYKPEEIQRTALALGLVPKDQVPQVTLKLPAPVAPQQPTTWERFCAFLTGLFA